MRKEKVSASRALARDIEGNCDLFQALLVLVLVMTIVIGSLSGSLLLRNSSAATSPSITLTPNSGATFSQITVSGTSFTSGQLISVDLYYPGYSPSLSSDPNCATVATNGTFQCTLFRIPAGISDNDYTVTASDPLPESASATFTVTSSPVTFSVSPTSGAAGSSLTVLGTGFYPTCGNVSINFGTTQIGTWNGVTGSFSVAATVPNVSPGTYAVYTEDCISDFGFASFTVNSGTTTTTSTTTTTTTTTSSPTTTSTSSTATSKTTRTSSVALQGLHLSEDWGFVGTPVLVEGNSFSAISPISVIFSDGSAPISVCETVSNAAGFFQCAMTVPSDVPAWLSDATITASDSMGNTASSPFTVVPSNLPSGTVGQVGQVINITTYGLLPIKGTAGPGGSHCVPLTAPCYYVKATITYNSQNGISIRYSASCVSSTNANPFQCEFLMPQSSLNMPESGSLTLQDNHFDSYAEALIVVPPYYTDPPGRLVTPTAPSLPLYITLLGLFVPLAAVGSFITLKLKSRRRKVQAQYSESPGQKIALSLRRRLKVTRKLSGNLA